eukprot:588025-Prymnesium_polylepis.2
MDGINGQFIDWGFKSATVVKRLPVDPKFYPGSDPKFFGPAVIAPTPADDALVKKLYDETAVIAKKFK